jgi:O-antigen/teichoic acid export membrane protein
MSRTLIAKNAAALMLSDVVVRAASAAGVVLVARSLGPRSYGILSVAIALSSILGYLSDLGLTPLTIQLATRPLADVGCILGTVFKARLALVAALVLASLAGILVSFPASEQRAVMLAVVLPTIGGMAMQGFAASYFVATQQLHVIASLKAASQAFSATALIFAFFFRWQVSVVAPIYGVTSLLGGIACLWMVRSRAPKMSGWDPRLLKGFAAFTVSGLTASSLPQMGPVIMGRVTASAQIGFFAAASRIPSVLYAIPACLGLAWYPQLFHAGSRDPARHFALSADQLKLNAILGFGLSLPTALYARPLIHLVLGSSWEASTAPILSMLCWMVLVNSLSNPFADALTTKGLQSRTAWIYAVALAIGSVLYAVLASARGAIGAAAAAVATQTLLSVGLILGNPSGPALLRASARRFLFPVCLASSSTLILYWAFPNNLIFAGMSLALYFLVAVAADFELRGAFGKLARSLRLNLPAMAVRY